MNQPQQTPLRMTAILNTTTLQQAEARIAELEGELASWQVIHSALKARESKVGRRRKKTIESSPPEVLVDPLADPPFGLPVVPETDIGPSWQETCNRCDQLSNVAIELLAKIPDKAKDWAASLTALRGQIYERKRVMPDDLKMIDEVAAKIEAEK